MFGGRNKQSGKRNAGGLSQLGLFDVPSDFDPGVNIDDDDDSDLEAELAALAGGGGGGVPSRPKRRNRNVLGPSKMDSMVSTNVGDDPDDDDVSVDDNDPELLSELNDIVGEDESEDTPNQQQTPSPHTTDSPSDINSILQQRLEMYQTAEQHAKSIGETSRARRYGRAIKTLKDLIKQAHAGRTIDESIIPPEVSVTLKKHEEAPIDNNVISPTRPAPSIPTSPAPSDQEIPSPAEPSSPEPGDSPIVENAETQKLIALLNERMHQYKIAALTAKKSGDGKTAIKYVKVAKQFEAVIGAVKNGQPVDLSKMPGPPGEEAPPKPEIEHSEVQKASVPDDPAPEDEEPSQEGLIMASSVAEALEQRLELYKKQEEASKEQGNSSKARRMGRIVKQYEQAIKLNKAGKPIPVDDLPTPPGYGPIPVEGTTAAPKPAPKPQPMAPQQPRPSADNSAGSPTTSTGKFVTTRADKQVMLLLAKQKEFKKAALAAKQKGEINEAKEYLRQAKGFDKLIEASRGGLPVDFSSLPLSPLSKTHLDEDYDLVGADECEEGSEGTKDILARLEAQLVKQMKMCINTRDHNKAIGDVAGANRFERLALNVTKDLDIIRLARKTPGAAIPKFHYETKDFAVVKSFTELNDNDLELSILRGINYNCANPKDIDTYVKYEFPYPQDAHYVDKTATVADTNNPEYNTTVIIPIQRTARTCQRVFKRHGMKFEVYAKSNFFTGLFKGDTLIGTANVKLNPLETQCEIHDSFDLLDGRKKTGGKLEVRIRLRQPIHTQEVEQIKEKWLVIDS